MRILVTGAGGFAGRHLGRYLASLGDEVIPCPGPDEPNGLDMTDGDAVQRHIAETQPEGIIHLAGVSSVAWSHGNPAQTFLVNGLGPVNLLHAVHVSAPQARVLLIGSGETYGRVTEGHLSREEDPLKPLSPYAASKCAAEQVAQQFAASYGLHILLARPFNHLGPGQASQFVVPSFSRQIAEIKRGDRPAVIEVGDLSPVRDFLHVEDVVRGYRILLRPTTPLGVYNVCSGLGRSIRSILDELLNIASVSAEVLVNPSRLRPVEIPWLVGDPTRLAQVGWQPQRLLAEALREVLREQGA